MVYNTEHLLKEYHWKFSQVFLDKMSHYVSAHLWANLQIGKLDAQPSRGLFCFVVFCFSNQFWQNEIKVWCRSRIKFSFCSTTPHPLYILLPNFTHIQGRKIKCSCLILAWSTENTSPNFYLGMVWMFSVWLRNTTGVYLQLECKVIAYLRISILE